MQLLGAGLWPNSDSQVQPTHEASRVTASGVSRDPQGQQLWPPRNAFPAAATAAVMPVACSLEAGSATTSKAPTVLPLHQHPGK